MIGPRQRLSSSFYVAQSIMFSQKLRVAAFLATLTLSYLVTTMTADQPVYFSLMVSGAPTLDTSGIVSAVDQALLLINNDSAIISGYNLLYSQVLDTQVSRD